MGYAVIIFRTKKQSQCYGRTLAATHCLGHAGISTTLNIYADVMEELRKDEFAGLDLYFKKSPQQDIEPQHFKPLKPTGTRLAKV